MQPLNNQVALKQVPRAEVSSRNSGIFIPQSTRERSNEAIVRAVGPGEWRDGQRVPLDLKEGDRVLFLRSGYQMTLNGERTFVVSEYSVLAKLDDDDEAEFVGASIDSEERQEMLGGGEWTGGK